MTHDQKELLRQAILLQLEAADPASLTPAALLQGVKLAGHDVTAPQLLKEISYLEGKRLLLEVAKEISKTVRRYRLTAPGRDYLEEQGLA